MRLSNQQVAEIKEREAIYQVAGRLGWDFSVKSPRKYEILARLHITNTRQLYALLKKNGYVFDYTIMKWRLK